MHENITKKQTHAGPSLAREMGLLGLVVTNPIVIREDLFHIDKAK